MPPGRRPRKFTLSWHVAARTMFGTFPVRKVPASEAPSEVEADQHMVFRGRVRHSALLFLSSLLAAAPPAPQAPESSSDRAFSEHYGWIYNDLAGGMREAQRKGQPLMVVIRCPP